MTLGSSPAPLGQAPLCSVQPTAPAPGALLAHNGVLSFLPVEKTERSLWRVNLVIVCNPSAAGKEVARGT